MAHPTGESKSGALRLDFDRRLKLEFHGSNVTSDAGLLPFRELDDILGLTALAGVVLSDGRRGKNTRHVLSGLLRQSVFGRLAGYEHQPLAETLDHSKRVWRLGPVLSRLLDAMMFTAICLRFGGGRRAPASSLAGLSLIHISEPTRRS